MIRLRLARFQLSAAAALAFGCSPPSVQTHEPATPPSHPEQVQADATVVSNKEAVGLSELLMRADDHLAHERYQEAADDYRLAADNATKKENRLRGLWGLATALDLLGEPEKALSTYSRFLKEAEGNRRHQAEVRVIRLLVYLERYAEAGSLARKVELSERTPLQQIAIFSARALDALARDDVQAAERAIARGRALVERHQLDRPAVPPLDVAAVSFALGELRRRRAEAIEFDPVPADFTRVLEERCQLILDAQAAFSDAMRSQDAHWSSMSGVRVGQLYHELHKDLMKMPRPREADTPEKKQLFEGALRLRYSILLKKSVAMMRATVALGQRTGQKTKWRDKAELALREIEEAEEAEEKALDALPYSRAQLKQVLDDMAEKARAKNGGGSN